MKVLLGIFCIVLSIQAISQEKGFCYASPKQVTRFTNFRTAGLADNYFYWDIGQTLYVKFLNGSDKLQQQIQSIAHQWEKYANIKFVFRNYGESHIRIDLNNNYLNSSLGNVANIYPQDEPNVHIDTSFFSDQKAMKGIVLHVFGHILGLEHENVVPASGRKWNISQIDPEKKWDETKIMIDFIEPYSVSRSNALVADPKSIMYQSFPAKWTNEKYKAMNRNISARDSQLIARLYPYSTKENANDQWFSVSKYTGTKVESTNYGFCFYPQFDLAIKKCKGLHFSMLFYDSDGGVLVDESRRYSLDEQVATTKAHLLFPDQTISVNRFSNEFGLFLPYSALSSDYKGKRLMVIFRVYIPDNAKDNASPDFNSKPFYISVPK